MRIRYALPALATFTLCGLGAIPVVVCAQDVVSITLPQETADFRAGNGEEIARNYCLICHSADYVTTQPPLTTKQWGEIVSKMQKVYGCPLPDSEVTHLVNYLVAQNPAPR